MSGCLSWSSVGQGGVITRAMMSWVRKQGQQVDQTILTDTGFHAKTGDPANMQVWPRGTWNMRMLVETVLSRLTTVFHSKQVGHRVWAYFRARVAWTLAPLIITLG